MSPPDSTSFWNILDNGSVAAFVGAFCAFVLVIFTDSVRRRLKRGRLRFLVGDVLDLARQKLQTVESNIDMLRNNICTDAPIMGFPTQAVRHIHFEVVDLMNANDNQALHGILYWADAIDALLSSASKKAVEIKLAGKNNLPTTHRTALGQEMIDILEDAQVNLGYLIQMAEWYVSGQSHKILEFQHPLRGPRAA